jgi:hypothetical protein
LGAVWVTRRSGAEELGALRPSAGVVRLEVGDIDELLDGIVEFRPRVGQDAFETLEGATGLGCHPAGDEAAVGISSGQSGGEQHSRGGDADSGHEAASLFDRTLGENIAAIHGVLLLWAGDARRGVLAAE